jgi:glycosyltransferase involved in cell wall biosynthesis
MSKNVLYLAENALSPIQGGGIVTYALLRGLRPENLFGFYTYENITPAVEYASRMQLLPRRDGRRGGEPQYRPGLGLVGAAGMAEGLLGGTLRRIKMLGLHFRDRLFLSDANAAIARIAAAGYKPEVIFAAPLSFRMLHLARRLAAHYAIPVVMLNMDDWMSEQVAAAGPLSGYLRGAIASEMRAIARRTILALSNSPHLAEVLTRRYGIVHDTVNNACYDLLRGGKYSPPKRQPGPLVITFSGALNWHLQGETLVLFSHAVAELAVHRPVELHVYTPWEFAPIANQISIPGKVLYRGFCSKDELVKHYLDSDFLVATTTFDERNILLFKHSLATKISDYLCAGRPVISVGHPQWAVHDYVEAHGAGAAIREPRVADIKLALAPVLDWGEEEKNAIGRGNRELWSRAHDITRMGGRARELLGLGPVPAEL